MRHLKKGRKFGRTRNQRRALLRALLHQLIMRERVMTTEAKAKELRPLAEKMVTMAKRANPACRKILASRLPPAAAEKLAKVIAPRFAGRIGGYARITKLGQRKSDASRMAIIEFVS